MISISEIMKYLEESHIQFEYIGNGEACIEGFSASNNYKRNTITWLGRKDIALEFKSNPAIVVVQKGLDFSKYGNVLLCNNSKKAFFSIIEHFFENCSQIPNRGKGTIIGDDVVIGENVKIGHNCTIDGKVMIGNNTIIHHNVTIINDVIIGENCEIQSGVRIGHDGFGYSEDSDGTKTMIKHYGGVIIRDKVFIGSNSEIARGTIDNTIIGEGTKIDALTHVAHNVKLGKNNGIVAGTTIYGSVKTGDNCYIATSVIRDQVVLGDNIFVGMNSTVTHDFSKPCVLIGTPAKEIRDK